MSASFASPRYEVERDPELPGDGVWRDPVEAFGDGGTLAMVLRITADGGPSWIAEIRTSQYSGYLTGWTTTPDPDRFCAIVHGEAFVIGAVDRRAERLPVFPVTSAFGAAECQLLLLTNFCDLVAFGATGLAWRSVRLVLDDLEIVTATTRRIECKGSEGGVDVVAIGVDPLTGFQIDGPVLPAALLTPQERKLRRGQRGARR
jgi:hypothetical protein